MATTTSERGQRARPRLPTTVLLGLLTIGTFAVGADSFVVAGMLAPIAADLSVPVAVAGQLRTAFAVTYAVAAPALAVLLGNGDRRRLLASGAALFALGAALQAMSTSMHRRHARRWAPRAGRHAGDRLARGAVAGRPLRYRGRRGDRGPPAVHLLTATLAQRTRVLGRRAVLSTLLITTLAQAAVMGSQVYLPTILTPAAGSLLPVLLAAMGVGAVVGTWASGRLVDRIGVAPIRYVALAGLALTLGAALPAFLGHLAWLFAVLPLFGVFAAVLGHRYTVLADAVPMDAQDLPAYAGALFDEITNKVGLQRLTLWKALERPDLFPEEVEAHRVKAQAVVDAYGVSVETAMDALMVVIASAQAWTLTTPAIRNLGERDEAARRVRHRHAVVTAVAAITASLLEPR